MTSAVGDIIHAGKNKEQEIDPSLLHRFLNSGLKGAVWLPDAVYNKGSDLGGYVGDAILNKFSDKNNKDFLEKNNDVRDPLESILKYANILQDLPEAKTSSEKYTDLGGSILGSLLGGGVLEKGALKIGAKAGERIPSISELILGTNKPVSKAIANPTTAATAGSIILPTAAEPVNQWLAPDSPKSLMVMRIAESLLGGKFGRMAYKSAIPGVKPPIPARTAAQQSVLDNGLNSDRTIELLRKQLDLAKKDPKSAKALQDISTGQEDVINKALTAENPISGKDVSAAAEDSFSALRQKRGAIYESDKAALLDAVQGKPIPINKTLGLLDRLTARTSSLAPLKNVLLDIRDKITKDLGDPEKLISAKTTVQDMAEYGNNLKLGTRQSAIVKKIAAQLNNDIEKAIPGYKDLNARYAEQTKILDNLSDSVIGKEAAKVGQGSSSIFQKIFENTDPEVAGQLKQILPEDVLNRAAGTYLQEVGQRGLKSPEIPGQSGINSAIPEAQRNIYNLSNNYQKIADILQSNRGTLQKTLPDAYAARVGNVLQKIAERNFGVPRNDFVVDSGRNVAVGDQVKGMGIPGTLQAITNHAVAPAAGYLLGGAPGAVVGGLLGEGSRMIGRSLDRNEMLTGATPTQQIIQGAKNMAPNIVRNTAVAGAVTDGQQMPPEQPIMPPVNDQQQLAPNVPPMQHPNELGQPQGQELSPIDAVMQKHLGQPNNAQQPINNQGSAENQELSPIDAAMQKYTQPSKAQDINVAPKPTPLSPQEIEFMTKKLQSGNVDSLIDFSNNFKSEQQKNAYSGNVVPAEEQSTPESDAKAYREYLMSKKKGERQSMSNNEMTPGEPTDPYKLASSFVGQNEFKDRDTLSAFFKKSMGKNIDPEQTAWCAAFVNSIQEASGEGGTGSLSARSFLKYGTPTDSPTQGDIVVLSRGSNPALGHVGFFSGYDKNGNVLVLGGNQSDGINVKPFLASRVLGFRKPPKVTQKLQTTVV